MDQAIKEHEQILAKLGGPGNAKNDGGDKVGVNDEKPRLDPPNSSAEIKGVRIIENSVPHALIVDRPLHRYECTSMHGPIPPIQLIQPK